MLRPALILVAVVALTGCTAAPTGSPTRASTPSAIPSATATAAPVEPGVTLTSLGFANAPAGISLPVGATISERTDSANNVTVVLTAPSGLEVLAHLRATLPSAGFDITADAGNSLLFTDGTWDGAFTISGALSALTLRTDR